MCFSFCQFQALGVDMVEKYFQEVVLAVEQSIERGADDQENYVKKLEVIYRDILTASQEGLCSELCCCTDKY